MSRYIWYPLMSDWVLYLFIVISCYILFKAKDKYLFKKLFAELKKNKIAILTCLILAIYLLISFLDSFHFKLSPDLSRIYNNNVVSLLDILLYPLGVDSEKSYSPPLAKYSISYLMNNRGIQDINVGLSSNIQKDIFLVIINSFLKCICVLLGSILLYSCYKKYYQKKRLYLVYKSFLLAPEYHLVRFLITLFFVTGFFLLVTQDLAIKFYLCGTDKIGNDVFFQSIKSIRTSVLIGLFTLIIMIPIAIILGILAGYFGGYIDDVIQYFYTTISSIPGVLLIAASILSLQVFISNHGDSFKYLLERADLRMLSLCLILGCTGWTSLCRIIRAETLKIRELEFITASISLGTSKLRVIFRHILPNIQHIVLISVVLDFSGLVLAEAVLSYVGVGVSPTTMSWGNMINSARLELAREPVVWWPIASAFTFMFILVFSVNVLADQVRDIIDPKHVIKK